MIVNQKALLSFCLIQNNLLYDKHIQIQTDFIYWLFENLWYKIDIFDSDSFCINKTFKMKGVGARKPGLFRVRAGAGIFFL